MSLKNVLANSLLMFVAAACVVLIVKSWPYTSSQVAATGIVGQKNEDLAPTPAVRDGVKVYYLHGNMRCPTCRTIEAYAQGVVQADFADELKSGDVTWEVINYELPGNGHFATDYEIVAPNVVLALFTDGKQVKWKGLPEVWEYVSDKAAFVRFMQSSLREFLGQSPPAPSTNTQPGRSIDQPTTILPIPE